MELPLLRNLIVAIFAAAVATVAQAQQPQRTFTLQVSDADLQVIGRALESLPYRESAPVIARLQQQVASMLQGEQVPAAETEKKADDPKAKKKK